MKMYSYSIPKASIQYNSVREIGTSGKRSAGKGDNATVVAETEEEEVVVTQVITKVFDDSDITRQIKKQKSFPTIKVTSPNISEFELDQSFNVIQEGAAIVNTRCYANPANRTFLPVANYTGYLLDPEYIVKDHKIVNGKLMAWRTSTLKIISKLVHKRQFEENQLVEQWTFARNDVMRASVGIQNQTKFPIGILNNIYLIKLVAGIDNLEMAHLIFHIDKYNFDIIVQNKAHFAGQRSARHIQIITKFSNGVSKSYGYRGPGMEFEQYLFED